jgi:hypothetical protein
MSEHEELAALIEATADAHNGLWPGLIVGRFYRAAYVLRQPVGGWQPISTAPKDGTEILVSDYDAIEIVSWEKGLFDASRTGWVTQHCEAFFPAWWQPLPDHPPIPQPPQANTTPTEPPND